MGDEASLFIEDIAFRQADGATLLNHPPFGAEFSLPEWFQEIDFKFESGERFVRFEVGGVGERHCGVGDIAEHTAMKSADGIGVVLVNVEFDGDAAGVNGSDVKSEMCTDRK